MHSEELGEYIGIESCTDFMPDVADIVASRGGAGTSRCPNRRSRRSDAALTEYPPPIPPSRMPWVMKKHSTSDGRLVITEEKGRRQEYFQVHRSDGRLVLNLVPMGDAVEAEEEEEEEEGCSELRAGKEEEKLGFTGNVAGSGEKVSGGEKRTGDPPLPPQEVYIGVESCGGFGVAMGGLMPPVHT